MFKQINTEQRNVEIIVESLEEFHDAVESNTLVLESQERLKSVIKKVLITNKVIPTHLAVVIAKTILFSDLIRELIERKKRYKKYALLNKVYDHITNKAAETLQPATDEDIDNVSLDILNLAKDIVSSIKGRTDTRDDIQQTFDILINKLTTATTERNRLSIMKLASKIVQSNSDTKKRREIIAQHLD